MICLKDQLSQPSLGRDTTRHLRYSVGDASFLSDIPNGQRLGRAAKSMVQTCRLPA